MTTKQRMTMAEARAAYGDKLSEKALRAAAEADDIEITEPEQPKPIGEQIAALSEQVRQINERARAGTAKPDDKDEAEKLRQTIAALFTEAGGELHTPSRDESQPKPLTTKVRDIFDQLDYDGSMMKPELSQEQREHNMRANLELAAMIFGGTEHIRTIPTVPMPEYFRAAWQHHVFEKGARPYLADGEGNPTRAMDTAETGYGLELIGVQYVNEMWMAARNMDGLVGRIREIPVTQNSAVIPIDGALPEMLFVGESTASGATAYSTSETGSGQATFTPKKFTIQQIWSGELNEDSIVAYTPFLRDKMNAAASLYLGSSYYNGDTTNAATGNINSDDADPADTKHYLAYDGIRHDWLVTTTGQGKDMAAELDPLEITRARGKLNAGDDDVDNLISNINWGMNARDLLMVMDWDTYMAMLELDVVKTVDQYGQQATVVTGELGSYMGIPLIAPSYASKTEADGKASTTEASNTKGQISLFNPAGYLAGRRRDTQLFFDRIQRTDQFLFELYTRRAFTRWGTKQAAGIYDITV